MLKNRGTQSFHLKPLASDEKLMCSYNSMCCMLHTQKMIVVRDLYGLAYEDAIDIKNSKLVFFMELLFHAYFQHKFLYFFSESLFSSCYWK